jgi:hypothetical protein
MSKRSITLVVLATLSPAFTASAQDRAPTGRGAPGQTTLTRSASKYQSLELTLIQALQDRSDSQLNTILSSDFEVWSAETSGPTSRADWQKAAFASRGQPRAIRSLTVREFGDTAVVSFLLQDDSSSGSATRTLFVVDVWTEGTNRLNVRYVSAPAKPAPAERRRE